MRVDAVYLSDWSLDESVGSNGQSRDYSCHLLSFLMIQQLDGFCSVTE